jgi:hypothetical protein
MNDVVTFSGSIRGASGVSQGIIPAQHILFMGMTRTNTVVIGLEGMPEAVAVTKVQEAPNVYRQFFVVWRDDLLALVNTKGALALRKTNLLSAVLVGNLVILTYKGGLQVTWEIKAEDDPQVWTRGDTKSTPDPQEVLVEIQSWMSGKFEMAV